MTKQGQRISASVSKSFFFSFSSFDKKNRVFYFVSFWRLSNFTIATYIRSVRDFSVIAVCILNVSFSSLCPLIYSILIVVKTFLHNFVETFSSPLTI